MLGTVEAVIDTLGGTSATAALTGVGLSAVSNWKARGRFPPELFLLVTDELQKIGAEPDPALFGFRASRTEAAP